MKSQNLMIIELGKVMRHQRKLLKLSQTQVAQLAGVSLNLVSQIESGKSSVHFLKLLEVLMVLGLQINIEIGAKGIVIKNGLQNEK